MFRGLAKQTNLVELLLSYGAGVNAVVDYTQKGWRYHDDTYGYSPLHAALISFKNIPVVERNSFRTKDTRVKYAAHLAILKLLVLLCDCFNLAPQVDDEANSTYTIEPCVVHFFQTELELGWDDDFTTTKYLLRNGAVANFSQFYDGLVARRISLKPLLTTGLLQLILMAGCKFDTYIADKTNANQLSIGERLWYDEHIQPVLDKVDDLLSQPLTLQELSIMAIRQSIGSRQLWAKIDSLPAPRSVKDMIQLKTYSPDKNAIFTSMSTNTVRDHGMIRQLRSHVYLDIHRLCFSDKSWL